MKRILLTLALSALAILPSFGQVVLTEGSLEALSGAERVNLVADFSFGEICDMDEEFFASTQREWRKTKPVIISNFIEGANAESGGSPVYGSFPDAEFSLTVSVLALRENGDYVCETTLRDASGKVLASLNGPVFKGETAGPVHTLFKQNALQCGKLLGAFIRKHK